MDFICMLMSSRILQQRRFTILSEARKYKLNLTMANQYIAQMSVSVRMVFGNGVYYRSADDSR